MDMEDLQSYLDEISSLKEKYKNKIHLYTGLEIDYLTANHNHSIDLFKNLNLDYRIGSVHLIENLNKELIDIDVNSELFIEFMKIHFNNNIKVVVKSYYDKIMTMISLVGIDFIGHPDKISMNASAFQSNICSENWYKNIINDYFHFIAEKNMMVEVNTKAYSSKNLFFPNKENFKLIKQLAIPVIVNSDSHFLEKINDGRSEALILLKQNGINTVMELDNGIWTEKEIIL